VEHLPSVTVPTLFVQGTRDPLCDLGLLRPVLARMARATLHTVEGGDHSLRLPRRAGRDDADVWSDVAATVARWLETLSA
jgi:predicted alpha/beta-hydrolase family hydrolase